MIAAKASVEWKKKDCTAKEHSNLEEKYCLDKLSDTEVSFHAVAEKWLSRIERTKKYATYIKYYFTQLSQQISSNKACINAA